MNHKELSEKTDHRKYRDNIVDGYLQEIAKMNLQIDSLRAREKEQQGQVEKLLRNSSALEQKLELVCSEKSQIEKRIKSMEDELAIFKAKEANLNAQISSLQIELSNKAHSKENQKAEEALRQDLKRSQQEKDEYFRLIKKLEESLEVQLERERELKKRFREKEGRLEDERRAGGAQLESRQKLIEGILEMQAVQQTEIANLTAKLEQTRIMRDNLEREVNEKKDLAARVVELEALREDATQNAIKLENALKLSEQHIEELRHSGRNESGLKEQILSFELSTKDKEIERMKLLLEEERLKRETALIEKERQLTTALEKRRDEALKNQEEKFSQLESVLKKELEFLKQELREKKAKSEEHKMLEGQLDVLRRDLTVKDNELLSLRREVISVRTEIAKEKDQISEDRMGLKSLLDRLEVKNEEVRQLVGYKERYDSLRQENEKLTISVERLTAESFQFNSDLKKQKERIKALLTQNDELTNEKLFCEAKIDRLEKRVMELLDSTDVTRKTDTEQEKIKAEIQSKVNRTQGSESKAGKVVQRTFGSALAARHNARERDSADP